MKNLIKAVISVMSEIRSMEKNSKVGKGQNAYDGTKDQDVKEAFNDAFVKYGLTIFTKKITPTVTIDRYEAKDYNGNPTMKQSVFTEVLVDYVIYHETGESMEIQGYGHGVDPQDKSAGKATTYALKNALLYNFLTPVGKIDDTDKHHSDEIPIKKPDPKPTAKPTLTQVQLDKIIEKIAGGEKDVLTKCQKAFTLTKEQHELILNTELNHTK